MIAVLQGEMTTEKHWVHSFDSFLQPQSTLTKTISKRSF